MRPDTDFDAVSDLLRRGLSDYEIARRTGVPRGTVQAWRKRGARRRTRLVRPPGTWRPEDENAYAYLLGLYLGDGHVVLGKGCSAVLRLSMDCRYRAIIDSARQAIQGVAPGRAVRLYERTGSVVLVACDPVWPVAFPQHGLGPKHKRPIFLAP